MERTLQGLRLALGSGLVGAVVVENDSSDRTAARLRQWSDVDDSFHAVTLRLQHPPALATADRTARLARLRNLGR